MENTKKKLVVLVDDSDYKLFESFLSSAALVTSSNVYSEPSYSNIIKF